jgi:glycerophosphodiester phosphodiesterase
LDRNLEDVDQFYNKKFADFSRRLKLLEDRYGSSHAAAQQLDTEEVEDLQPALLELRGQLRKLQWYGEVNRKGFIKITKKLDKKVPSAQAQKKYLDLKVDPSPFATNTQLVDAVTKISDWLRLLSATKRKNDDDNLSLSSSSSLKRVSSKPTLRLSAEEVARIEHHIREDNAAALSKSLDDVQKVATGLSDSAYQQLLNHLLQRSIFWRSRSCIATLLKLIIFIDDQDDINKRNCIHRLVIAIGRSQTSKASELAAESTYDGQTEPNNITTPALSPILLAKQQVLQETQHRKILTMADESVSLLQYLLDQLRPTQRSALLARDTAGRSALHYAAQYGVRVVCQIIIEHLQSWKLFDIQGGIDGPAWQDSEGWAPLHLSVVGGHPLTTQVLLGAEKARLSGPATTDTRRLSPQSSAVLAMATKANFVEIVRLLVQAGVDVNYQDDQGETALHVAARFGHDECAKILLEGNGTQKADMELVEKTYAWSPLFIACVDGNLGIVDLLTEAGADLDKVDSSGWTPKEHASLRGHMAIAQRLAGLVPAPESDSDMSSNVSTSPPTSSSMIDRSSNGLSATTPPKRTTDQVKSFGHRYLTDQSMLLVSLGTMDMRKATPAVSLDRIPLANAHATQLDTALSIVVSASGTTGEPEIIDLPVHDNIATEPVVFYASDPTKVKLLFDLIPTYAGTKDNILGRGVALLSTIKPNIGSKRISLQGDLTVPIIAANTMDVIGSVTFNFLIITPFQHPNMSVNKAQTYWKSLASTMVIGHRGLGKNIAGRKSLQLGENTIQSFIAAANLGASYVEFDVQLTKDLVPVIYHDFLVSETGIDAPVHTLTLEQFLHVNDARTPRGSRPSSRPSSPVMFDNPKIREIKNSDFRRQRSLSVGPEQESYDMDEKMKHTRTFKKKGFKGNTRGNHIQGAFATLEEMFKKLPKTVGFNIEMKYPMLHESEDEEMDTYAVELNSFVDTVLTKVYDLGEGRNMIFSSFNPDICLLLSFKQPSIPVLFLTDAGTSPVGDIRASSLQEAIRFASRWNLLGVVTAAEPLVISPRLVRVVKESGLVCVSYGTLNNDQSKVQLQVKEGIDAVIVDSVLAIRKGLTEAESKAHIGGTQGSSPVEDVPDRNSNGFVPAADTAQNGSNGDIAGTLKPTPAVAEVGSTKG